MMGESSNSSNLLALANKLEHEILSIPPPILCDLGGSSKDEMEMSSIMESIEKSKSHWSEIEEFDSNHAAVEVSNMDLFQTLRRNSTWGGFFKAFGEGEKGDGELVMGDKFAEGGQAELYEVQIKWNEPTYNDIVEKYKIEFILKVFKNCTLQHLQSQWPKGMLEVYAIKMYGLKKLGLPIEFTFHCHVHGATLLEDGSFAFLIVKEGKDLRSVIDERMEMRPKHVGPFLQDEVEFIMYQIALGMDQLHGQGIVHRDVKASNVLCSKGYYVVADFECLVGVVGTGFFRAPEILEACKKGNVNENSKLFTKAVDVYAYGMTCYEILTGKLPFEGRPKSVYDFVLKGQRPGLPKDVDDWIHKLLERCWHKDPLARPSFRQILKVLVAKSRVCRKLQLSIERQEVKSGIRKDSTMAMMMRSLKMVKLKMMSWNGRRPYN